MDRPMAFDYDPESGEYFSRPADEFDGIDPQAYVDEEPEQTTKLFTVTFHMVSKAENLERRMSELRSELSDCEDGCSKGVIVLNALRLENIIFEAGQLLDDIRGLYTEGGETDEEQ